AHNNSGHMSAAVSRVIPAGLIENDDQQSILLKLGAVEQGSDVAREPNVGDGERTVVRVVEQVGDDEGKIRQLPALDIRTELRKRNQVVDFGAAVHHVGKRGANVVTLGVGIYGSSG